MSEALKASEFPESRSYESQSRDAECASPALGELAGTIRHTFVSGGGECRTRRDCRAYVLGEAGGANSSNGIRNAKY